MQHVHATGQVTLAGSPRDIGAALFREIAPKIVQALRNEGVTPEKMTGFFEGVIGAAIDAQTRECGVESSVKSLERIILALILKGMVTGFKDDGAATPAEPPPAAPTQPAHPEQPATQG